jgi:hypothetical protein
VIPRKSGLKTGDVFDFGFWAIADEVERIEANFAACGSDTSRSGASPNSETKALVLDVNAALGT